MEPAGCRQVSPGVACWRNGGACLERGGRSSAAEWPRATTDLEARRPRDGVNTRDDRDDRARASGRRPRASCTASVASVCVGVRAFRARTREGKP